MSPKKEYTFKSVALLGILPPKIYYYGFDLLSCVLDPGKSRQVPKDCIMEYVRYLC
jgi:hypothetical protein